MLRPVNRPDDESLALLERWHVDDHQHLASPLRAHLLGVHGLLKQWGARPALCRAGLFHAVDSTQHFHAKLARDPGALADSIGAEAAGLIALYTACDRDSVWVQIGRVAVVQFNDRHTGATRPMSASELADFCELTMANELDILRRERAHRDAYGALFRELLSRMRPFVSAPAWSSFVLILGERERPIARAARLLRKVLRRLNLTRA